MILFKDNNLNDLLKNYKSFKEGLTSFSVIAENKNTGCIDDITPLVAKKYKINQILGKNLKVKNKNEFRTILYELNNP